MWFSIKRLSLSLFRIKFSLFFLTFHFLLSFLFKPLSSSLESNASEITQPFKISTETRRVLRFQVRLKCEIAIDFSCYSLLFLFHFLLKRDVAKELSCNSYKFSFNAY